MQTGKKWGKMKKPQLKKDFDIENKKKNVTVSARVPGVHQSGKIPRNYCSSSGRESEMEISHWQSNEQ